MIGMTKSQPSRLLVDERVNAFLLCAIECDWGIDFQCRVSFWFFFNSTRDDYL
jgi:hypothetical protein